MKFSLLPYVTLLFIVGLACNLGPRPQAAQEAPRREVLTALVAPSDTVQQFGFADSVHITIPADFLDEPQELRVVELQGLAPLADGVEMYAAFGVSLGKLKELPGVIEIALAYDPSLIPAGVAPERALGALHRAAEDETWTQVTRHINAATNQVIIETTHLSDFALTTLPEVEDRSPMARLSPVYYLPSSAYTADLEQIEMIFEQFAAQGEPGDAAVQAGWDAAVDTFSILGAVGTFSQEALGLDSLDRLNSGMGELGLGLAIVQLALQMDSDEPAPAVLNFSKSLGYYALGKWGVSAMKIASVGVFMIDYSLGKFAAEAISGREEMYLRAYERYYQNPPLTPFSKRRSAVDWYWTLHEISATSSNSEQVEQRVAHELEQYVTAFWRDPDGMTFAFAELGQGFSYSGGSNPALERRISDNHKAQLVNEYLQAVFQRLARQLRAERVQDLLNNEMQQIVQQMNEVYTVRVNVLAEDVAATGLVKGLPVKVLVNDNQALWAGETNESGEWQMQFTLLGYLLAGAPQTVRLYGLGPDGDGFRDAELTLISPDMPAQVSFYLDEASPDWIVGVWRVHLTNQVQGHSRWAPDCCPTCTTHCDEDISYVGDRVGQWEFVATSEGILFEGNNYHAIVADGTLTLQVIPRASSHATTNREERLVLNFTGVFDGPNSFSGSYLREASWVTDYGQGHTLLLSYDFKAERQR